MNKKQELRKCRICEKEFKINKTNFPKISNKNTCRSCMAVGAKKYFRGISGLVTKIYNSQSRISKKYNHDFPFYTKAEFKVWIIAQDKFNKLYENYVASDYDRWLTPHCTRIDKEKPFKFDNLLLCTWREGFNYSMKKKKKTGTKVDKYTLDGVLIKSYSSIKEVYDDHDFGVTYESVKSNIRKDEYFGFKWSVG